ncbi:uncharacterized protein LOC111832464 [Capsella rubella]|uniref:uncharacterized protein LOC111832464 n=1 Tax=Capsella rubella TaxID=81985 RepID=UPI000CD5BC91|nr:uncharacterized protein LOC111832464 [Capsella rubella]
MAGFSSSHTWESLRPRKDEQDWADVVWFKGAVPKHAFNMWLSHLNRLPTRDRLAGWGITQVSDCCICSNEAESRDHLLLNCDFAAVIWRVVFSRLSPSLLTCRSWAEMLSWTRRCSRKAPSILRKLAAHTTIFHIWKQRNNAYHNSQSIPPLTIFKSIDREIRNTITSRSHLKRFERLMSLWIR